MFDFSFRLAGFKQGAGIDVFNNAHPGRQFAQSVNGGAIGIDQEAAAEFAHGIHHAAVFGHIDFGLVQRFAAGIGELGRVYKQSGPFGTNQQIGDKQRVERNVVAAQMGQPGNIIERRNQMVVCTEFFHRGTHTGEFFRRALGLETGFVHENRVVRQARAVVPEAV